MSFSTGDARPFATPNLIDYVNYFSTTYPTNIDIVQRNTSGINLALYDAGLPLAELNYYYGDVPDDAELLRTWQIQPRSALNETSVVTVELNDGEALPTGLYYFTMITAEDKAQGYSPQIFLLAVGDTNLVVKEMVDGVYAWATDLDSGQPVPGLNLTLYDYQGLSLGTAVADRDGLARFDYEPEQGLLQWRDRHRPGT